MTAQDSEFGSEFPPADQAGRTLNLRPGNNGIVPPVDNRFQPGRSGNPKGRPSAGMTIKEHINAMAAADMTEADIRRVARDKKAVWARRTAAERILRTLEAGDLADFSGLLSGEKNLEDLRGAGINTEVVKKFKQKRRRVPVQGGNGKEFEEVIEREIELHDRAGVDFDRIMDRTEGRHATQVVAEESEDDSIRPPATPEEIEMVLKVMEQQRNRCASGHAYPSVDVCETAPNFDARPAGG